MAKELSWNFPTEMYGEVHVFSVFQEISAKSRLNSDKVSLMNEVSVSLMYEKLGKNSRNDAKCRE